MKDREKILAFLEGMSKGCCPNETKEIIINKIIPWINDLPEEPVSEDLKEAAVEWYNSVKYKSDLSGTPISAFRAGALWQKEQDKETIELAEDHAMLAGMEKMKEQMMANIWKPANGDDLPKINREVIALLNNGKVIFAHRPYKRKYIGKNLITGNIKTFENEAYGEGGWNIPDIKWWLDVELPKEIEL